MYRVVMYLVWKKIHYLILLTNFLFLRILSTLSTTKLKSTYEKKEIEKLEPTMSGQKFQKDNVKIVSKSLKQDKSNGI